MNLLNLGLCEQCHFCGVIYCCLSFFISIFYDFLLLAMMLLYNILVSLFCEIFAGNNVCELKTDYKYISNLKHKKRNFFQHFKFKLDCVLYMLILALYIAIAYRQSYVTIIKNFVIYLVLIKIISKKVSICLFKDNKKTHNKVVSSISRFIQKNSLFIIITIFVPSIIYFLDLHYQKNCKSDDLFSFIYTIIVALCVWGFVEYMTFRYDVIRDVVNERDDMLFKILKETIDFDEDKINNKCIESIILRIIEDFGVTSKYYSLTTEYNEIFNSFIQHCTEQKSDKKNYFQFYKQELLKINDTYSKKTTEYWYFNCILNSNNCHRIKLGDFDAVSYYDYDCDGNVFNLCEYDIKK